MGIVQFWERYWFFILIFLFFLLEHLYSKYLKPLLPEKKKMIVKKTNFDELSVDKQKQIIIKEQREIQRKIKELKLKEKQLLRKAQLNAIYFDYLDKLKNIK